MSVFDAEDCERHHTCWDACYNCEQEYIDELKAALKQGMEAARENLKFWSYKDEQMLLKFYEKAKELLK